MARFSKFYITALTTVWIGYGLYCMMIHKPNSLTIFLFGLGFTIVFFMAVWFSHWMIKNYKKIETMSQNVRNKRRV